MSLHALITGELYRDPQPRTSAGGKPFTTCQIRTESDGQTLWASVICFSDDGQAELARLKAGDAVAVQGRMKVTTYEKNGEIRPSLDITASSVLALKPKPRERKPKQSRPDGRQYDPRDLHGGNGQGYPAEDGFDDEVPF